MSGNEKAYSVTQINKYLKAVLDEDFILKNVRIAGEISNYKRNYSGHLYFSLKDEESALSCVMFSGDAECLRFEPQDGMKVTVSGGISVYVKSGQYQLYVRKIEREGKGDLFERFEELKRKLLSEGLFDSAHKKPIPSNPGRIAVITSPTGAAVKDIISVIRRRNKSVDIVIFPVLVQGTSAAAEISEALRECNRLKAADIVIIGRGGGSIEDLWAFNEEIVARAVFDSKIPVISGVGHETDFTISDFVADMRAATPSVSAEIAVPLLVSKKEIVESLVFALNLSIDRLLTEKRRSLSELIGLVKAVSPLSVLERGYSLTYDENEETLIKSASQLKTGDVISTTLSSGKVLSRVIEII